ncbi:MAG: lytic transglycosylase domain-containing protein [Dyella sp.]
MTAVAYLQEHAGRRVADKRPRRRAWCWLVAVIALAMAAPSLAGTLYRCSGAGGEVVFTGSRTGYQSCKVVTTYREAPARRVVNRAASSLPKADAGLKPTLPSFAGVIATAVTVPLLPRLDAPSPATATTVKQGQWSYQERRPDKTVSAEAIALASVAPRPPPPDTRELRGAVYRVVRKDGSVEYTNIPPANQHGRAVTMLFTYIATCVACNLRSPINWNTVALDVTSYAMTIRAASSEFGVDQALLRAVIHAESAFNPRALSIKGAQGLMQLMPGTAGDMGVSDAFDAEQNIRGGARYLALLLKDFHGDERLAAAAYNAGEGAVQRYRGVPPYAETQVYVERVGTLRRRYGAAAP